MRITAQLGILILFLVQCVEPQHCIDPAYPYWCPKSEACCSSPYTDGKGCYSSLNACSTSGGSCETCTFSGSGPHLYANWTCNGSSQCATVMGATGGTAGPFCDQAACEAWGKKYIPGGYTCSTTGKFNPSSGTPPNGRCFQPGDL